MNRKDIDIQHCSERGSALTEMALLVGLVLTIATQSVQSVGQKVDTALCHSTMSLTTSVNPRAVLITGKRGTTSGSRRKMRANLVDCERHTLIGGANK